MSGLALMLRQVRYTNKTFWRNPASAFFTFAFPLLFLVIFTTLLGNSEASLGGETINTSTYYVASMATFGLIGACYTNIAISLVFTREAGILKRTRGTPLPSWSYLGARVLHAALVGFLLIAITVVFGVLVYGASFPTGTDLFRFVVTVIVGAACFAAIGLAVCGMVPNADAGPPIINAIILPLLFLSGVFIVVNDDTPTWVNWVGRVFPVRHLVDAMRDSFLGLPTFRWWDVVVLVIWLVVAVVVAIKTFKWEPNR
jgi:ABC-2 type transport system permease protein